MSRPDSARTARAERCRQEDEARTLARWCYSHGIGPAVGGQAPPILRAAARRADVSPPHLGSAGHSATWGLVADLLTARAAWDRAHGQQPPPHVACIACAIIEATCPQCTPASPTMGRTCPSCKYRLDPVLVAQGFDLHPTCDMEVLPPTNMGEVGRWVRRSWP